MCTCEGGVVGGLLRCLRFGEGGSRPMYVGEATGAGGTSRRNRVGLKSCTAVHCGGGTEEVATKRKEGHIIHQIESKTV